MPYQDHFTIADDTIVHLDTVLSHVADPFAESRCAGLTAVAAVCVYELAIKELFISFAEKKHGVFGRFADSHFRRINGRIKLDDLRDRYIVRFGDKYLKRFRRLCEEAEKSALVSRGVSVCSCYGNIITWRNQFAHNGQLPFTATYGEIKSSYKEGKEIIHCLAKTMVR